MDEKTRQLLLLISFMSLLTAVFVFINVSDLGAHETKSLNVSDAQNANRTGEITRTVKAVQEGWDTMVKGWKGILKISG